MTGKYTPLDQWLHLDFLEMLPDEVAPDGQGDGGRYDHVIRLFGEKFVREKIMNARTFMVRLFLSIGGGRIVALHLLGLCSKRCHFPSVVARHDTKHCTVATFVSDGKNLCEQLLCLAELLPHSVLFTSSVVRIWTLDAPQHTTESLHPP